jgi:hypothetical protein
MGKIENLKDEVWKSVQGWKKLYEVSNMGRVKVFGRQVIYGNKTRHTSDKILKPSKRPDGYYVVGLCRDGGRLIVNLHRLVAEHFVINDDFENKNDVDHKDGDKSNNKANNLRWTTRKENLDNRKKKRQGGSKKVICITTGEIFNTLKEASEKYNVPFANIGSCCKGYTRAIEDTVTGEKLVWKYYRDYIKDIEESAEGKSGLAN